MLLALILAYLFPAEERVNLFFFAGRVLVYVLLVFWGVKFIVTPMETNYVGAHFMHPINLRFIEPGHFASAPFARFRTLPAGSRGQFFIRLSSRGGSLSSNRIPSARRLPFWWF